MLGAQMSTLNLNMATKKIYSAKEAKKMAIEFAYFYRNGLTNLESCQKSVFGWFKEWSAMPNNDLNVKERDATDDHSSNEAGSIKEPKDDNQNI